MTAKRHITFILNPAAGRGKARHIHDSLRKTLLHSTLDHTLLLTSGPGDAEQLARSAAGSSAIVVAVGGDGTVNETASGLVGTDTALAVLSEGSGNDFARIVGAPDHPEDLLGRLEHPLIGRFDHGVVQLTHADGSVTEKRFFNSLGLGFDAAVADNVRSIRWLRGIPLYMLALVKTLIGYRPHRFTVTSGDATWRKNYFLLCIGIGKWEGGGFMLTPDAVPDDGLFDVCGAAADSIGQVLPVLPLVMVGKHVGKKHIEMSRTTGLIVDCPHPFPVHGDGEIFGLHAVRAEISIVPGSLNVVLPPHWHSTAALSLAE